MWLLKVVVLVSSLHHPLPHPGFTAYIPFPTQYTCEEARDYKTSSDDFIRVAHITNPKITIKQVTGSCVAPVGPLA